MLLCIFYITFYSFDYFHLKHFFSFFLVAFHMLNEMRFIFQGQKYNQNTDWWSFGILLFEMLVGQSPFSGCDEDALFWSICNEMPWYPFFISDDAINILGKVRGVK